MNISKSNLLNLFEKNTFPLSANQMLKELKLSRDNKRSLKDTLKNLLSEGKIKKVGGGKYLLRKGNSTINNKPNKNSEVKVNANTEILGDLIKQEGHFFLKPRNDELPLFKIENNDNTKCEEGDLVLVKSLGDIKNGYPLCVIIKSIGKSGEIKIEKEGLLIQHGLEKEFPKSADNEARSIPESFNVNQINNRVDLTTETIFTIDGDDARDFDDAVGIKKIKSGYKLWVSIADVSHYVKAESPLDIEANKRATSTYLSDSVIPMLPEKLSNNLCSLVPGEARFTKTAEINFDLNGNLANYKLYNSFIKSSARLTYGWVSSVLNGKAKPDKDNKNLVSKLELMYELYKKLKKKRIEKGELEFDFPEPHIIRDVHGNVINIQKSERNIAHGVIEEFMISANSVVA
ncbi:MAG: RNB domain-containing ribonuclease, partial [Thermodesulfobacteriota bacterium]